MSSNNINREKFIGELIDHLCDKDPEVNRTDLETISINFFTNLMDWRKNKMNLEEQDTDYKTHAWNQYTITELGNWVHNFVKRSKHRANKEKASKDLHDAKNYCSMIEEKIKIEAANLGIDWNSI